MIAKLTSFALAMLTTCFLSSSVFANSLGPRLTLEKGTKSLGGSFSVPVVWDKDGRFFIDLNLEPTFSIFLGDNIEFSFGPIVKYTLHATDRVRQKKDNRVEWGVLFSGRYFFDLGSNFFYMGLGVSATAHNTKFEDFTGALLIPIGFLLPLNEHLAIDIGVPAKIHFSPRARFNRFELPFGYFGLQAYF